MVLSISKVNMFYVFSTSKANLFSSSTTAIRFKMTVQTRENS